MINTARMAIDFTSASAFTRAHTQKGLPALFSQSETRFSFQSFAAFRFANIRFASISWGRDFRERVQVEREKNKTF